MNKTYLTRFIGRKNGAIGVGQAFTHYFYGKDEDAARLSIYDTHEHLTFLQMAEVNPSGERTGTCHFRDMDSAISYYAGQGLGTSEIPRKIHDKEIEIGWPKPVEGQKLGIDSDGRFWILG